VEEEELESQPKNGSGWMQLAFARARTGDLDRTAVPLQRATMYHGDDIESQLLKIRTLELLGKREEALDLIAVCLRRGATRFQIDNMPDLGNLRKDPRYSGLFQNLPNSSGL
jgi:hypothetical protein